MIKVEPPDDAEPAVVKNLASILDSKHQNKPDLSKSSVIKSEFTFTDSVHKYDRAKSEFDYTFDRNENYDQIPAFHKFKD